MPSKKQSTNKKRDPEETPYEIARRLVREKVKGLHGNAGLAAKWDELDKTIYRHARLLKESDGRELMDYIQRRFDTTRTLVEGLGHQPEFGFSSELIDEDGEW